MKQLFKLDRVSWKISVIIAIFLVGGSMWLEKHPKADLAVVAFSTKLGRGLMWTAVFLAATNIVVTCYRSCYESFDRLEMKMRTGKQWFWKELLIPVVIITICFVAIALMCWPILSSCIRIEDESALEAYKVLDNGSHMRYLLVRWIGLYCYVVCLWFVIVAAARCAIRPNNG